MRKLLRRLADAIPAVSVALRTTRDQIVSRKVVPRRTPHGFLFAGNPQMMDGTYEMEEVEVFRSLLPRFDVLVNIGANVGYYCCLALAAGKRAIVVEPIDTNLRVLYRNIASNGWCDRVEIFPVALSAGSGLLEIYGSGTGASLVRGWAGSGEHYRRWIPVHSLDQIMQQRLAGQRVLFLVDVEGHEYALLQGAAKQLALQPKPLWLMEIVSTKHVPGGTALNPHWVDTFAIFGAHGYRAETANRERRRVTEADVTAVAQCNRSDLGTHNFIFGPPPG